MDPERCDACGFDGSDFGSDSLLAALRELGPSWRTLLRDSGDQLRLRPAPEVWSAIEYAAHSRDITALHAFGVEQALTTDEPAFAAIEGDDLIQSAAATYDRADADEVVLALESEANRLADLAERAGDAAWSRGLTVGDSRMDVRRLLEHALHDSRHHLDDVERGLGTLRARDGAG